MEKPDESKWAKLCATCLEKVGQEHRFMYQAVAQALCDGCGERRAVTWIERDRWEALRGQAGDR